jgi:hypothetical protein
MVFTSEHKRLILHTFVMVFSIMENGHTALWPV